MSGSGLIRYRRRCASTRDSTKPASRNTRRCLDTEGCGSCSCNSMSPTDCSEVASRLRIARRLGSAMIENVDSMERIYLMEYISVKAHESRGRNECERAVALRHRGNDNDSRFNEFRPTYSPSRRRESPMSTQHRKPVSHHVLMSP